MLSAGSLLLHLLDWVRLHKADVDEKARDVLQSDSPAEHRDYWDVVSAGHAHTRSASTGDLWEFRCAVQVVSYVLQGRLDEARQMLGKKATLTPAANNMYKMMDNLLSKMPFYNVSTMGVIWF